MISLENESLKGHTTIHSGGTAKRYIIPESVEELSSVICDLKKDGESFVIIGNGSNFLFSDNFYGNVIEISRGFQNILSFQNVSGDDYELRLSAGISLQRAAREAMNQSLTGLEALSGIPGTIGGAIAMNAGAYGSEIKDVLKKAVLLDMEGNIQTLSVDALSMGYRHSIIQDRELLVTEAVFNLKLGKKESIRALMEEFKRRRISKQPIEYPSAGSVFKRPEGNFAGRLIEEAGLKGYSLNGCQVSEKHAGFIINRDKASSWDIYCLISYIQKKVYENSGILLEPEIKLIGFNDTP